MPTNSFPILLYLLFYFPYSPQNQPLASPIPSTTTTMTPCQSNHDITTTTFHISNFLTFEPSFSPSSSPSSSSATTTLLFTFLDPSSTISTTCTRVLPAADIASGAASLNDSSYYQVCDDTSVSFVWDGTRLTVLESWSCGDIFGELVGRLDFLLTCFDMTPSYTGGKGTLCELMAEEIVGRFTTVWDSTGYYAYGMGPDGSPLK